MFIWMRTKFGTPEELLQSLKPKTKPLTIAKSITQMMKIGECRPTNVFKKQKPD